MFTYFHCVSHKNISYFNNLPQNKSMVLLLQTARMLKKMIDAKDKFIDKLKDMLKLKTPK